MKRNDKYNEYNNNPGDGYWVDHTGVSYRVVGHPTFHVIYVTVWEVLQISCAYHEPNCFWLYHILNMLVYQQLLFISNHFYQHPTTASVPPPAPLRHLFFTPRCGRRSTQHWRSSKSPPGGSNVEQCCAILVHHQMEVFFVFFLHMFYIVLSLVLIIYDNPTRIIHSQNKMV